MTVYVYRNGRYVDKATLLPRRAAEGEINFPSPRISRFESFESPITGKEVTSWRERDREMNEHDCFDPRDLPADHVYRRGRDMQLKELEEIRADGERAERNDTAE